MLLFEGGLSVCVCCCVLGKWVRLGGECDGLLFFWLVEFLVFVLFFEGWRFGSGVRFWKFFGEGWCGVNLLSFGCCW